MVSTLRCQESRSVKEDYELIKTRYADQVKIAVEHDPEFATAWFYHLAHQDLEQWEAEHRPMGTYREDSVLKVSETHRVFMRDATREHLLGWALHESDERNLAYVKNRLSLFDAHPECRTLAELEVANAA